MTTHLTITTKEGTDKRITVTGLRTLELKPAEEERFRATLQAYVQQFYDQGFKNVEKVEIQGRFGSGKSGAFVFPIVLFTPREDPTLNHYRVLKYDDACRIEQELLRYNTLASQAGGTYEQLEAVFKQHDADKSLLSFRDLKEQATQIDELLTCILQLRSPQANAALQYNIRKVVQDVLGRLYEYHYCNSDHHLAKLRGFKNLEVREIFAGLFPPEYILDEDRQAKSKRLELEGVLIGLDALTKNQFRKRYLVTKKKPEDTVFLVETITCKGVDEATITAFLTTSVEERSAVPIQGQVIKTSTVETYLHTSVTTSTLPDNMIDWQKLYAGLQSSIASPYWAFHLHNDLNPGNIVMVEQADGTVQGKIIDYYSFGPGGHLFTDIARLEALLIMEYVLQVWADLLQQHDYVALQTKTKAVERALFFLDAEQPHLTLEERAIVEIALEIRRIGLNWLIKSHTKGPEAEMAYKNYLFARYAYLLSFQKYADSQGKSVLEKKQLALCAADALLDLIQAELRNLKLTRLLAGLNAASEKFTREQRRIVIDDADVQKAEIFRRTKETALLVIMLIDVVNSTRLREELGEVRFQEMLDEQKGNLTSIIEREHTGKVVKDTGDGLLAVFAVADAPVQRALDIQESLASHPILQVRIGLDMGQVMQETDERGIIKDVFGRHVNIAARLEGLCEGGYVLVSYPVWYSAKGWLKQFEQIAWKDHGCYRVKGIDEPLLVYEPYDAERTKPLSELQGEQVPMEEAVIYCPLCGRSVKVMETFKCRTCGKEGICMENFDKEHRQCTECATKPTKPVPLDVQKLIDLKNPEASFTIRIWTEHSKKRGTNRDIRVVPKKEFGQYHIDDEVVAYFQSDVDAYVYMINIGPTGNITHLLPNDYTPDNHVKGGKQYTFPDKDAPFEWILQEPVGAEIIKVIATKVPVDVHQFLKDHELPSTNRDIGVRFKPHITLSPEQWAEAACTLLVQKQ